MRKNTNMCKRMKSFLLQAEVYVRYPQCTINKQKCKRYVELRDIEANNGFYQKYVTVDYPITPESVNSYADAADYRKNPEVINQAVARRNLGDITETQKILNSDMTELQRLVKQSQEVVERLKAANAVQPADKDTNNKEGDTNGNSL